MGHVPLVISFPFSPVLFHLGPIPVRWYGLGYAVAFLTGWGLAGRHLAGRGVGRREFGDLAFWSIVVGLVAARLYFDVQNNAGYFVTHPQHLLATWEGGMAYFGAVLAVPIFIRLWSRAKGLDFWLLADGAALFAAVGQPIGRIGNIFNGDILGYASNLPWAFAYTSADTMAARAGVAYQPAALYELLVALGILTVLLVVRRRVTGANSGEGGASLAPTGCPGALFLLYLALYAVSQFGIFFFRANSITALGLKQGQLSSLALLAVLVPLTLAWWGSRRHRPPTPRMEVPGVQQA